MRKTLSLLAAAAAAAVSFSATPASAQSYCFGAPSEPLTYVCVVVGDPGEPGTSTESRTVTVPSVCYGVGCTPGVSQTVTYPVVTTLPSPGSVSVEWAGAEDIGFIIERVGEYIQEEVDPGSVDPICFTKPAICLT